MLAVTDLGEGRYILLDTRGLEGIQQLRIIDAEQAAVALSGRPSRDSALRWARDNKLVVNIDSAFVPLATASPTLLEAFEA